MEVLLPMEALGGVVENRGVDVAGSVVGEAEEGVEITEGEVDEVDEDVESSTSLYNFEMASSRNYLVMFCTPPPHTSLNGRYMHREDLFKDGRDNALPCPCLVVFRGWRWFVAGWRHASGGRIKGS